MREVLDNIPSLGSSFETEIFVVDDCSEDGTFDVARKKGVEVTRHSVPLGVGGALKTGYSLAKEWGADIIVQLDADGEHDPADLQKLLRLILEGKADMAVGSRFLEGNPTLSFTRSMGIIFFTWLVNRFTGFNLTDISSGYRVFSIDILDEVEFPSEKHWAIGMTLLAGKNGVRIKEVPITCRIRKTGNSQFHEIMAFVLYPLIAIKQIVETYI